MHSDTRLSLALGLLERTPRLETQLDSKLSSLGSAGLERLGGPRGQLDPRVAKARALRLFFSVIERGARVRARDSVDSVPPPPGKRAILKT